MEGFNWSDFITITRLMAIGKAIGIVVTGLLLSYAAANAVQRYARRTLDGHTQMVLRRVIFNTIFAVAVLTALHQLGINLSVLVGAAGVLTVAVGFAAQTSTSNLISGLFLLGEKPFVLADVVRIGDTTGEVVMIGFLSTRLRTFDNLMVRIPNETIMKSQITNMTRNPIRRIDLAVGVAFKEDLARVRTVLFELADKNPLCLDEPRPQFFVLGFGEHMVNLQLSVWTRRENYLEVKNGIFMAIKKVFDEQGIEIPYPHRTVYAANALQRTTPEQREGDPT